MRVYVIFKNGESDKLAYTSLKELVKKHPDISYWKSARGQREFWVKTVHIVIYEFEVQKISGRGGKRSKGLFVKKKENIEPDFY